MSLGAILETIFIGPLKLVFEVIFQLAYMLVGIPGVSIIFLSLAMNFLVLPLYRRADAMQMQARDTEARLKKGMDHIKKTFSGSERMMILQTYYRQNDYSPLNALHGSISLLLEIPFFMAAYQFLSHLELLRGVSFGPIADLGVPDGMISIGGTAVNAVPGQAEAELACDAARLQPADKISVEPSGKRTLVHAQGKSAHASTPDAGESAIDLLAEHLLSADVISDDERRFLELVRVVTAHTDGSELGITASDEHFGALSCVGGTIRSDGNRIYLSIDFRYPTTITSTEIADRVQRAAERYGAAFALEHDKEPFLMDPSSAPVQALLEAYNDATGECAEPFTMKGGTYARVFTTGVSFGPEKPWEPKPSWVGSMHGPDEGIREDLLKQAFSIYVRTIAGLMETVL